MNFFIMSAVFANVFKLSGASEEIVKMMETKRYQIYFKPSEVPDLHIRGTSSVKLGN